MFQPKCFVFPPFFMQRHSGRGGFWGSLFCRFVGNLAREQRTQAPRSEESRQYPHNGEEVLRVVSRFEAPTIDKPTAAIKTNTASKKVALTLVIASKRSI